MSNLLDILPIFIDLASTSFDRNSKLISKITLIDTKIELWSSVNKNINDLLSKAFISSKFDSANYKLAVFESDLPVLHQYLSVKDSAGQLLLRSFSQDKLYVAIDRSWNAIYFLDKTKRMGGVWAADYSKISLASFITPLRTLLSWCVDEKNYELIHAAGLCIAGKGVALTGPSGSGKSTLAIYAATKNCEILGDDAILVNKNRMHAVYPNAKVDLNSQYFDLDQLGVHYLSDVRSKKAVLNLQNSKFNFSDDLPLDVIVFPELGNNINITKISKKAVVREFLPQTMKELLGGTTSNARNLFEIVSNMPFFKLELGPVMDENLEALYQIVEMV